MNLQVVNNPRITLDELENALPGVPLYGEAPAEGNASEIGWQLSPQPYALTVGQAQQLEEIGHVLYQFSKALEGLYRNSMKDSALTWVRQLLEMGKPQTLLQFSQMKRFKDQVPLVIRPDLLVTEKGFSLCEIDAVPGGIGFTAALSKAYRQLGFSLAGAQSMPDMFLQMLLNAHPAPETEPFIALIVSDEAGDYRRELQWLVDDIAPNYANIALIHPRQVVLERDALGFLDDAGRFQKINIIYRFFELFDLPNIPQIELIQYAVKKGLVICTPPFKPHLEEKLMLALIHAPMLEAHWLKALGESAFDTLKAIVPESWILDPAVIPPHAAIIPNMQFKDKWCRDFTELGQLTQKQRELVIKPSGFSPIAWGSKGVKIGHDLPAAEWQAAIDQALAQFHTTPWLLQRFENTRVEPYETFHPQTGEVISMQGRTRLCPYYFVVDDTPKLAGILATTCPKDKKIIHGMRDGVMRPCFIPQNE